MEDSTELIGDYHQIVTLKRKAKIRYRRPTKKDKYPYNTEWYCIQDPDEVWIQVRYETDEHYPQWTAFLRDETGLI